MNDTVVWLQVRRVGSEQWMNLREHTDEATAAEDLKQQRAGSQPQWEFRVAAAWKAERA